MILQVDPFATVPVYQQIIDQVRLAVARGELKPGDRLEPVRHLAERLTINPGTAARAYQALEQAGVIETNRRRGSVIARSAAADAEHLRLVREGRLRGIVERSLVEALAQGYSIEEIEAALGRQLAAWREQRLATSSESAAGPDDHRRLVGQVGADATTVPTLRFAGSHDLALEVLWPRIRQAYPALAVHVSYVGSLDGLLRLLHGEADIAGAHILDDVTGEYNLPILQRVFPGHPLHVVTLAERQQGLIVAPGNPLDLHTWADLAHPDLRFVNRQIGSGTRTLLDLQLRLAGIASDQLIGYDYLVPTHLAAAAAVAEGKADAALGLFAAARAYGLAFVPLARERYDLVLPSGNRERWPISTVVDLLRSADYRRVVMELGGYDTRLTGQETVI